jgi:AraC-like DNA-binding protein
MTTEPADLEHPDVLLSQSFVIALAACGVDEGMRQRAMRSANVKHGLFWTTEVGPVALQTVAQTLAELSGDPRLGMRIALKMPAGATGVLEYLLRSAPTLRSIHTMHTQIRSYLSDYVEHELSEEHGYARIRLIPPPGLALAPAIEDYRLTRMALGTRNLLRQPNFPASTVCFTYRKPACLDLHYAIFGKSAALRFEQPFTSMDIPASTLDFPLPGSEPVLHRILWASAHRLMAQSRLPAELAARVRQVLVGRLHEGKPGIAEVGKTLGMSERTLRRRLADEGTSFADLLDEVRAALARSISVSTRVPERSLAQKLGFESQSAFRRAQRRWRDRGQGLDGAA